MAETLGSIIDKLTIKNIRLKFLKDGKNRISGADSKIRVVNQQRNDLIREIDDFVINAVKGKVRIKDPKVKLYNKPARKAKCCELGGLVDRITSKNLELWGLEDEVRRNDISNARVVRAKRNIDIVNQSRNDLIDSMDELLERKIRKYKKK